MCTRMHVCSFFFAMLKAQCPDTHFLLITKILLRTPHHDLELPKGTAHPFPAGSHSWTALCFRGEHSVGWEPSLLQALSDVVFTVTTWDVGIVGVLYSA